MNYLLLGSDSLAFVIRLILVLNHFSKKRKTL